MDYQVKAVRGREMVLLSIAASHEEDAMSQVRAQGYVPISAESDAPRVRGRHKKFPLVLFSQELLTLLDAGLNLVEAIEALAVKDSQSSTKAVLDGLLTNIRQGMTFSAALEQQSNIFPILYVSTVRASEKTGDLPVALERYVAFEEQVGLLKKKIISSSIYPAVLIGFGGLVIMFLLGFVVPKFSGIYEGAGGDLPFLSQVLLSWGGFLERHGQMVLIAVILTIIAVIMLLSQAGVRRRIGRLFWRIPAIGQRVRIYQLSRFYRTLGMLLNGGTPIMPALQSVSGLLDSTLQSSVKNASHAINQGQPISQSMEAAGLTTPIASRMLAVGERSGNVGDMMERIAGFYDEELSRWIEWFTRLFEPFLMLTIGLAIGGVVLLLYMPIFELAGNIQ